MAMVQWQHALVGMLWLTFIALGRCRSLKENKVLKLQTTNSSAASIKRLPHYGHLTIGVNKSNPINYGKPSSDAELYGNESFENEVDYQSDTYSHVVKESERLAEGVFSQGNKRKPAVDRLLGMKPMVECAEGSMTLKLHGTASLDFPFFVDRGNSQPLSFSKMPSVCGYSVRKNWRNLVFSTPYDGCYVAQEDSVYVLPLLIYGLPVRMACPSMAPKPPPVSCHIRGMTVKIESSASVKDIKIKVNSKWDSLMKLSSQCGFSVVEHPEGVIISAPYFPCIKEQDGMLTLEVAAEGDFKISCPAQPSDMHVKVTACPETSSTSCLATPLADSQKPTQTPQQSIIRPTEQPKYPIKQIPNYIFPKPEYLGVLVPQVTQAPLDPVYPKKPILVEDPSRAMPPHIPEPVPFPAQSPFYIFHPGFYPQYPKPVTAAQSPKSERLGVLQQPQKPVPRVTQAPLDPVYPKKPILVEDPSESMPPHIPEPVPFPAPSPFYIFHPGFYPQYPKPVTTAQSPKSEHLGVLQQPQKPVPQVTQAPLDPVYPKKPTPVEDPSESMPPHIPEPLPFPAPSPFYIFHPGFYPQYPKPVTTAQSPKSEHLGVLQQPQKPVPQVTQAPLDPVYPKKPTPVEDPSKSMSPHIPKPVQSPAQLLCYIVHPANYPQHPKPVTAAQSPQSEHLGVPQQPQKPVSQVTQAPLDPVYPKKPILVEDPSRAMPPHIPEPVESPAQSPFYIFHPGYYAQHPKPVTAAQSPKSEHLGVLQQPQERVPQVTQAPLDPVYPKKPMLVEDPSRAMPPHTPEPVPFPAQSLFYIFHPGYYAQHPKPITAPPPLQLEHSGVPQQPQEQMPQKRIPQATQTPLHPVYPKNVPPTEPAHVPNIPDLHPVPQRPSFVPMAPDAPDRVIYQPTHCSTVCTVAYPNCCPPVLSFHQHHHHHNHVAPLLGQMVQPAPAAGDQPSYFEQVLHNSLTNSRHKLPYPFLNVTQETFLTPFLQRVSYQEQDAQHMPMFKPDPTVKLTSTPMNQSQYPSWNSYMNILANGYHSKNPSIPYSVQLTQQLASKQPNPQPVERALTYQWLQHPYDLPASESTSNLHPDITNNAKGTSRKTTKSPGLQNNVQATKDHILKLRGTVKDPAPYPGFQIPYFVPYLPPTSKPNTHPEALASLPHQPLSFVLNTEAPSSKFYKYLMSTPPFPKSPKHSVPHPWVQHPFSPASVLRPKIRQQVQNSPDFLSDPPQVQYTPLKRSILKPSGSGSQKQYQHQVVPPDEGYPKVPFSSGSSKSQPQHVGPSKKTSSQHISSGPKDKSLAPYGSTLGHWKPVRPLHHRR